MYTIYIYLDAWKMMVMFYDICDYYITAVTCDWEIT